MLGLELLQ